MTAKGTVDQTNKAQGENEYPSTRAPVRAWTAEIPGSAGQSPLGVRSFTRERPT